MNGTRLLVTFVIAAAVIGIAVLNNSPPRPAQDDRGSDPGETAEESQTPDDGDDESFDVDWNDNQRILQLFETESSGVMVLAEGAVQRVLPDDNDGSRHQRFIVELEGGHTVLVAHNIDLAPRVPLAEGDRVRVYGQYEWNERGGVLHWTHHDPRGAHEEGWVEWQGQVFE